MQSACAGSSSTGASSSEAPGQARGAPLGAPLGGRRVRRVSLTETRPVSELVSRVEGHIRRHGLLEPGASVLCLVSGGADSTCLYHVLRELGYRVSALHVDHGLRGAESDEDARWCAEQLGAQVVQAAARCSTEAALR